MADIKKIKPSLPKGTRDFLPEEVAKRNYIFDTIKKIFRKYGFQQIDTPAFERLETLTGKYGEEGDRLLFKIINSGDPFKDFSTEELIDFVTKSTDASKKIVSKQINDLELQALTKFFNDPNRNKDQDENTSLQQIRNIIDDLRKKTSPSLDKEIKESDKKIAQKITEKGLRYDLTVPLARYVVQHQSELTFPFKRFHIAPVWRADRPQKGRYQEFYQCDADVIGSTSLLNEVELTLIYVEVFAKLGIDVTVRVNNRKLIDEILNKAGATDNKVAIITLLDKLDKVEWSEENGIGAQIVNTGLSETQLQTLHTLLFDTPYAQFKDKFSPEVAADIDFIMSRVGQSSTVQLDPTLMRGLDYYTGTVWEIKVNGAQMGSIGGGGRYDNLTEMFGGRDMSGVGISFGIERIYDVMEELKLFPGDLGETTRALFVHFDEASEAYAFEQLQKVRAMDIASEIYPGKKKLDKQMNYANDKNIPYVIVVGGDEMASGKLTFKDMASGHQEKLTIEEIIGRLKGI